MFKTEPIASSTYLVNATQSIVIDIEISLSCENTVILLCYFYFILLLLFRGISLYVLVYYESDIMIGPWNNYHGYIVIYLLVTVIRCLVIAIHYLGYYCGYINVIKISILSSSGLIDCKGIINEGLLSGHRVRL